MPNVPPLNAAQPRPIPSFESMRIGDQPLPTSFVLSLKQSWTQLYDLRDYLLNLFVDDEVPNGPLNGQNKTFTLANAPVPPQSLELHRNGQFLVQGTDYNLIGKTITLAVAPFSTDTLIAFYRERLSVPNQPSSQPIPPAPPTGGGGGSTGGLWTQNANFLYPTATFTECVLVGAQTSDFFGGPGQLGTTGTIGMMTAAANASLVYMFISPGVETQLVSNNSGTGTLLPLSFYVGGLRASISTGGVFYVGARTSDLSVNPGTVVSTKAFIVISATANASIIDLTIASGTCQLVSGATGTGTILPISFNLNSIASPFESARIRTGGSWLFGLQSSDVGDNLGWIVEQGVFGIVNATTNANALFLSVSGTTETIIHSSFSGAGTALPMSLYLSGVRYFTLQTSGALLGGLFTTDIAPTAGMIVLTSSYFLVSAATNASTFQLHMGSTCQIISSSSGTGTILPITFFMAGNERARFVTTGAFLVGIASSDSTVGPGTVIAGDSFVVVTATTNASRLFMNIAAGTDVRLVSGATGTGTNLPMSLITNGGTRVLALTTNGEIIAGAALAIGNFPQQGRFITIASGDFIVTTALTGASSWFQFAINPGTSCNIQSNQSVSGTQLPIWLVIGGIFAAGVDTNRAFLVGTTTSDLSNGGGEIIALTEVAVVTAATNASVIRLIQTAGTANFIQSTVTGTGTSLPIAFAFGGTEVARFTTAGAFLVGITSTDFANQSGQITVSGFVSVVSATTNATTIDFHINGTTETLISSSKTGTGTFRPLSFYTSNVRAWTIANAGALIGGSVTGGSYGGGGIGRVLTSGDFVITSGYTANESFFQINMAVGAESVINSSHIGTGTDLQISLYIGSVLRARIDTTGRFLVGLTSTDASSGNGNLYISSIFGIVSATANAHALFMSINGTTETVVHSSFSGTGTSLPLSLYVNAIRGMTLTVANPVHVLIGTITDDGTGALLQVHGNISVNGTVLTVP